MKIAVEGCCHGELDNIYETLQLLEQKNNIKVDLLLICGDFQSVRNKADMECMAVPSKYMQMNTFYKYYSGEKVAPVLTVFIGGNHEASNYLQELPYGGWVAPKIYYMGYANVVKFGGVRIGGMSGIYKGKDFNKGHFEHPPYTAETKRTAYHVRNLEVFRLKQISRPLDIFLSHDWPQGIYNYGNTAKLLKRKAFLRDEVETNTLGNPAAWDVLVKLQPSYWFSAHLHVKFPAMVKHVATPDGKVTKFLSLDKCLPRRHFLQVLDIPSDSSLPLKLQLDPEWLAILKLTNGMLSLTRHNCFPGALPGERQSFTPTDDEMKSILNDFGGNLTIPENFSQTVPVYDPNKSKQANKMPQAKVEINPQTTLLCSMLDLTDPNAVFLGKDSTFNLPNEDEGDANVENADSDDENVDEEEELESEPSFISLSGSERSFSDKSFSFISAGNDSILSMGQGNDSIVSLGNADEIDIDSDGEEHNKDETEKMVEHLNVINKPPERRLSLAEKLQNCKSSSDAFMSSSDNSSQDEDKVDEHEMGDYAECSKKNAAGKKLSVAERLKNSVASSEVGDCSKDMEETDDVDDEFAAIMSAQRKHNSSMESLKSPGKSDTDQEIVDMNASKNSSSSLDCQTLEIADEDEELQEMLNAQKSVQNAGRKGVKQVMEVAVDNDDDELEMQEIIAAQKKSQGDIDKVQDIQDEFGTPKIHSSPVVKDDRHVKGVTTLEQSLGDKALSKRDEKTRTEGFSPAAKKFKRRNQDLYITESSDDV
ncbi:lariat debranching enzyme-like [Mya arenaria]|uniref:lariat debranching enzyme-like n=1 Tax=Mya arenaria TaxID=6604 RepID=UPI0022DF9368|nr:lariat debranching enzyme-like [Mya arenaria]